MLPNPKGQITSNKRLHTMQVRQKSITRICRNTNPIHNFLEIRARVNAMKIVRITQTYSCPGSTSTHTDTALFAKLYQPFVFFTSVGVHKTYKSNL